MDIKKITEEIIQKLKNDIKALQKKALDAMDAEDDKGCRNALEKQGEAIENLIKITETYNRKL